MAKAPLSQTVFLTEDGTPVTPIAVDIPPTDVAPPEPVFTSAPSVTGTPRVGQPLSALTYIEGTVTNGSVIGRTYLLNGAPKPISYVLTEDDVGASLVYRNTATGGVVMASSAPVTVQAAGAGSLQRLALSQSLHYGEASTATIGNATPGSTIQLVTNSLDLAATGGGMAISGRGLSGIATARSILLRETLNGVSRDTLIGAPVTATPTMTLGMNLSEVNYYTRNDLFIDFLKCGGWADNNASRDANGMPTALSGPSDYLWPVQDATGGAIKYRFITDGDVDVSYYGIATPSAPAGTGDIPMTALTKEGSDYVFIHRGRGVPEYNFYLRFSAVRQAPTRMAIVRDDEHELFTAGEIFRPAAVADLKRFSCLRDLNMSKPFGAAFNVQVPDSNVSYYLTPLSILAKLAIKTAVPLWHQINYRRTDAEFIADLPILADLHARGLLRGCEVGNEIWNEGTFGEEHNYAKQQALANPAYTLGNPYYAATWWQGYRSAQLAKIAADQGSPLPFYLGPQPVQPGLWYVTQAGRDAVAGRPPNSSFRYMSTAYCSGVINLGVTGAMGAALDEWIANHNLDALLDNALNYPASAPDWGQYSSSILQMGALLSQAKANADADGMELDCYEANGHFNAQPYATGAQRTIQTCKLVFVELYKSVLMKIAARQILETAQAAGVKLLNWFEWNGTPTQFESGYFATKDLPAYQVLIDWQASLANVGPAPAPAPAPSPTPAPNGHHYWRLTTTMNVNGNVPNDPNYRTGSIEIDWINDGVVLDKTGWTAADVEGATADTNIPQNAIDGNPTDTLWATTEGNGKAGVIVIDTKSSATVATDLRIRWFLPNYIFYSIRSGRIEVSNDGVSWALLKAFSGYDTDAYAGGFVIVPLN